MMNSTGVCRWLFLAIYLSIWILEASSKEMRVVCYYTNWSIYRPGAAKFSPQNINPYLCTHLVYAFGGFTKDNTLKPFDKYQDIEKGGYAKFTGLKTYNKNLKTLIAIGGWNEGSSRFSSMVANPERRKELVKNVIKFLRLNHFDGLDLDWEYPAFRDGGKPRDKENYANLVQELREEFEREFEKTGRPRLLLTMAVPAGIEYINKGFDVPKLTKYLDWMNILSYDYHSAFEPAVNHHAPLFPLEEDNEYNFDGDLNIDHTIKHYLKLGAQPNKLVVGIPTYGRSYTLFNPDAFEIGSPADGPGSMGEATRENGYLAYYEICDYVKNQDWEVDQPNPDAMGPIAFKEDQWVGYDDESIVRKKAEYVAENGLGGIMFWAIDNDDFRGTCHGKPYPLIEAGKEALLNAYGITEDNLIEPPSKLKPSKTRTRAKSKLASRKSQPENENVVEKPSTGNRRRNRITSNAAKEETTEKTVDDSKSRRKIRRKNSREREETSSYNSLKVVTPSYTTPAPPSTPDLNGAFKCEDEGFFPHPMDCKKYFWCLSGAGDSGIVAHQFTCPAGLYFNKAADSCDYSQNVLCNKKLQKASKSTTSTTSTTPTPTIVSTSRVPPKITAATSRTTFRQTTTTEAFDEDDYEYEDDDEDEEEDTKKSKEEDPRVIKELIDLIKKAGGIEELEKQLRISKGSSQTDQFTTQTPLSKSLERVLSKTLKKTPASRKTANSRGPQNEGLRSNDENKSAKSETTRGKLSYTSIIRNRSTTIKSTEDEDEEDADDIDDKNEKTSEKSIEYVNIRRNRISSSTSEPENKEVFNRNRILGEDDGTGGEGDDSNGDRKNSYTPQYVNIRRPKPSTTEEPETSKYVQLRRGTTESTSAPTENTGETTTSKYKILRRGTTTSTTTQDTIDETSPILRDETTTSAPTTNSTNQVTLKKYVNFRRGSTTEKSNNEEDNIDSKTPASVSPEPDESTVLTTKASEGLGSTTPVMIKSDNPNEIELNTEDNTSPTQETLLSPDNNFNGTNKSESNLDSNSVIISSPVISTETSVDATQPDKRPQFLKSRPFLKSSRGTTPKPISIETTPKVSQSNLKYRLKIDNSQLNENTPNKQYRTRGSSRFNSDNLSRQDKDETVIPQKRRLSTTEKYIEDHRSYRPSELADLSSLTAVDFSKIKELDFGRITHRRRRPVTTTTTTTTTEDFSEIIETSSRPPSVTKKLTPSFGRSRKLFRGNLNKTLIDSEGETKIKTLRGFGSRSTREPSTTEITTESTYSSPKSFSPSPRNRKIIRRLKVTTTTPIPTQKNADDSDDNILNERSDLFPKNSDLGFQQNRVEDENDDDEEEGENIKLSESNIRENSAINSFSPDPKLRGKLTGLEKSYIPEKIPINGKISTISYGIQTTDDEFEYPSAIVSTEPSVVVRTRKIIRKLSPTEATITTKKESDSGQTFGRRRKVIRKLRPISEFNRTDKDKTNDKESTEGSNKIKETVIAVETTTTGNNPEHLHIPLPDDTIETTDIKIDYSPSITETTTTSKKLFQTEPTVDTKETGKPKRLFRPKLYSYRNKSESKLNTTDETATDSEIIRINSNVNNDGNKRIATRGRNKIFRPKIFETRNKLRNNKEEPIYSENRISSTPRYSFYSRLPNIKQKTVTEIVNSPETKINPVEFEKLNTIEPVAESSTEGLIFNVNEFETTVEPEKVTSTEYQRISSTEDIFLETSTVNEDLDEAKEKDDRNKEFNESSDVISESQTSTEYFSTEPTDTTSVTYRFRRPNNEPYFRQYQTTTTKEKTTDLNETAFMLTSIKTGTDVSSTTTEINGSENINYSSTSDISPIDDGTADSNNTIQGIENYTEAYTTEYNTIMTDLGITTDSLTDTISEIDAHDTDEAIQITENLSTPYDLTTLGTVDTNNIDNVNIKNTSHEDQETTELFNNSEQTEFETTSLPETTTDGLREVMSEISSSPSSEPSTQPHRTYTLRPVSSRPKFIPPKLKDLSFGISSEKGVKPKVSKFGLNRFKSTTASDLFNDDKSDPSVSEQSTNIGRPKLPFKYSTTERNRFNKYKKGYNSRIRVQIPDVSEDNYVESSSTTTQNRFLYTFSTTQHYNVDSDDDDDDDDNDDEELVEDIEDEEVEENEGSEDEESDFQQGIETTPKTIKSKITTFSKNPVTRLPNKPIFSKPSTEDPRVDESLKDIDTEAIKNRNKSLFSKKRVMNTPFIGQYSSTSAMTTEVEETSTGSGIQYTSDDIVEMTKSSDQSQTTEDTTIRHIFADIPEDENQTTELSNPKTETTTNKIERLIEVNRIIKVETKEEHVKNHLVELKTNPFPIQDKVGEVNRVTVIKVVDTDGQLKNEKAPISSVHIPGNSSTTDSAIKSSVDMIIQIAKVQEIPAENGKVNLTNISVTLNTSSIPLSSKREGKRIEIFGVGGSKIVDNKHHDEFEGKPQIIDGLSNINIVTPRPVHNLESSTIPLEGLFQTEGATLFSKYPLNGDELLEADHSKFVSVRVPHPDQTLKTNQESGENINTIPIKFWNQDAEEYAMKADVVEVPAKTNLDTIRIAPIKVQMSKSIANNLPLIRLGGKSFPPT
ncbi:chitinase 6 isoform X2 [Leptinotarsa decemlineata]|uniref:chitinase 6 isoform X2 n=1 Tax=Leptinotarsa decemlineata TaxID=7539 RepID=UPI003D306795